MSFVQKSMAKNKVENFAAWVRTWFRQKMTNNPQLAWDREDEELFIMS